MENIDFAGFTYGFIEIEKTDISLPSNAVKISEYADDMSILNCILAVVPIIAVVLYFLNKEIRKYSVDIDLKNFIQKYFIY